MDLTAGPARKGCKEHPAPSGRQDQLARSDFRDRMAKTAKMGIPAHVDLPGRLAPKVWPVLPALTVTTETKVRLAHLGLAVFRVRLVRMESTEKPVLTDLTDSMGKMAGQSPLR